MLFQFLKTLVYKIFYLLGAIDVQVLVNNKVITQAKLCMVGAERIRGMIGTRLTMSHSDTYDFKMHEVNNPDNAWLEAHSKNHEELLKALRYHDNHEECAYNPCHIPSCNPVLLIQQTFATRMDRINGYRIARDLCIKKKHRLINETTQILSYEQVRAETTATRHERCKYFSILIPPYYYTSLSLCNMYSNSWSGIDC